MKFKIDKSILLNALEKVSKALPGKVSNESFAGIKISVWPRAITLTATNGEFLIKCEIPNVEVEDLQGDFIISGKYFVDIIKKIDESSIEISVDKEIVIKTQKSTFKLKKLVLEQFPTRTEVKYEQDIILNTDDFVKLAKSVSFAASTNYGSRVILTSVNFKTINNKLIATATDGFRLAQNSIDIVSNHKMDINVPVHSINELLKIYDDSKLQIRLSNTHILFTNELIEFESRLNVGTYPNTDTLIPKSPLQEIILSKVNLINSIERATVLLDSSGDIITMKQSEILNIISKPTELGQAKETLTILGKSSDVNIKVSASAKYLLDAFKSFKNDKIKFEFHGEVKPIIIKDEKDSELLQLVLPVRLQSEE